MKRIKTALDVPWFKIKNYEYISELNDYDLLEEFSRRRELYNNREIDFTENELFNCYWEGILIGDPNTHTLLKNKSLLEKTEFDKDLEITPPKDAESDQSNKYLFEDMLSFDDSVYPLGILQLLKYKMILKEEGIYKRGDEFDYFKSGALQGSISKLLNEDIVSCQIGLSSFTDEEILSSLKTHLPKWREKMKIPEPSKRFIKSSEISKIRSYRIIPILDLMIWEAQTDNSVPKSVIAALVFPIGEMGSEDLSGGNAKISNLLNILLSEGLTLSKFTGEFHI